MTSRPAGRRRTPAREAHAAGRSCTTSGEPETTVYLPPERLLVYSEPCTIKTILGSCVAVCLWDPGRRIGGMNHFVLPYWPGSGRPNARFGDVAVHHLIERVLEVGGRRGELCAKVYGGACVLGSHRGASRHLGLENADVAFEVLEHARIPVVERDVGGHRGRKLIFEIDTGSTSIRKL